MPVNDSPSPSRVELSRIISSIENGALSGELRARLRAPPASRVIGITGPPGAGKSTLVDALIGLYRQTVSRLAVIAVDPSSPVTGGAVLGDRVRMNRHAADEGVFIRSMGSRGRTDGLSPSVRDATRLLACSGYDPVFVETVGVGQIELGVVECCDIRVLVLAPQWGDYVQAVKAGLIEVVDLIVVNKADMPGARALLHELEHAVHAKAGGHVKVVAATAGQAETGATEVPPAIDAVWQALLANGLYERRVAAARAELSSRAQAAFAEGPLQAATADGTLRRLAEALTRGEVSAWQASEELLARAIDYTRR